MRPEHIYRVECLKVRLRPCSKILVKVLKVCGDKHVSLFVRNIGEDDKRIMTLANIAKLTYFELMNGPNKQEHCSLVSFSSLVQCLAVRPEPTQVGGLLDLSANKARKECDRQTLQPILPTCKLQRKKYL